MMSFSQAAEAVEGDPEAFPQTSVPRGDVKPFITLFLPPEGSFHSALLLLTRWLKMLPVFFVLLAPNMAQKYEDDPRLHVPCVGRFRPEEPSVSRPIRLVSAARPRQCFLQGPRLQFEGFWHRRDLGVRPLQQ